MSVRACACGYACTPCVCYFWKPPTKLVPHSGSQSVCSAIGSTQLTAATATCWLAAAKTHYCSLRLSESLGGSPHAYTRSFIDLTHSNQKIPTTGKLTDSSPYSQPLILTFPCLQNEMRKTISSKASIEITIWRNFHM